MALRLMKEWKTLQNNPAPDVELYPQDSSDLLNWVGFIKGPKDSAYEDGTFQLSIKVPANYPLVPPTVHFVTKVFHPNIHFKTGEICLDLLKNAWSAVYTIESICRAVIVLLTQPEPYSPLNCDAGNLLRCGDIRAYNSLAKMYTKLYANKFS